MLIPNDRQFLERLIHSARPWDTRQWDSAMSLRIFDNNSFCWASRSSIRLSASWVRRSSDKHSSSVVLSLSIWCRRVAILVKSSTTSYLNKTIFTKWICTLYNFHKSYYDTKYYTHWLVTCLGSTFIPVLNLHRYDDTFSWKLSGYLQIIHLYPEYRFLWSTVIPLQVISLCVGEGEGGGENMANKSTRNLTLTFI